MLAGFLAGAELQGCFLVKFPECFYEAGAAFVSGFMADLQDTEAGIAKKLGGFCHTAFMDILSDGYVISHLKTSFQLLFIQKQQLTQLRNTGSRLRVIGENLIRLADGRQVERRKSNLPVSQHGTWAFFIQAELAVFYRFTDASKTLENASFQNQRSKSAPDCHVGELAQSSHGCSRKPVISHVSGKTGYGKNVRIHSFQQFHK